MKINIKPTNINIKLKGQKIYPALENLEITPRGFEQKFNHPNSYGYNEVTVNAIESEEISITPSTEKQELNGLFGKVTVNAIEGEMLNIDPNEELQTKDGIFLQVNVNPIQTEEVTADLDFSSEDTVEIISQDNKYIKKAIINKDNNLIPENIKTGTEIFGVTGSANVSNAKITNCRYLFQNNYRIDTLYEILSICENVTDTSYMFSDCSKLTNLDLSNFDTSSVTDMSYMFYYCSKLTSLDLSSFNTSSVTNMSYMFYNCSNLTSLDLSNFDTSNVTNMIYMFNHCSKLANLDLSNFDTSKLTSMYSMFSSCSNLTSLDLSNFDTSNVMNMSDMFYYCSLLTDLDLSSFDMSKVINTQNMFRNCNKLTNLKFGTNLGKGFTYKGNNNSGYVLNLSKSTLLTYDSLMSVINNLYDLNLSYNVANGGTLYTQSLTLGSTNMAKLTEEEIAIATSKGWSVS